jgi:predicted phage terminase large subunit-like protein
VTLLADPTLTDEERVVRLNAALRLNHFMGETPDFLPQIAFMLAPHKEVLYGGATKGGKTSANLMAALQWVDFGYYNGLILHRTFVDLNRSDGIIPRFRDWTDGAHVRWDDENHAGIFPSGAKLTFGFIERAGDERRYKMGNYQYIGWEELTEQPDDHAYRYLFSRLARPAGSPIPLRVRANTNPDGPGRIWVKDRWGIGAGAPPCPASRLFIPARLDDNPHIDQAATLDSLLELDDVTYAQLRSGDWDVSATGDLFDVPRLVPVQRPRPEHVIGWVRYWDKAGTGAHERGATRAKFTVGLLLARVPKALYGVEYIICDVVRGQWGANERDAKILEVAGADPPHTTIWIEQEPGSGGKQSAEISISDLAGYDVRVERPTGDKVTRARPVAAQVNGGNVGYVLAAWNETLKDELRACPNGVFWDQVDTLAGAFNQLRLLLVTGTAVATAGRGKELAAGLR